MTTTAENKELMNILQNILEAEDLTHRCCSHLSLLAKNGRIRNKLSLCAKIAENNRDFLRGHLNNLGISSSCPEGRCQLCRISPDSFSTLGAINLGLEVTNISIKFYKDLLALSKNAEEKKIFNNLLKEKTEQKRFLKKEKKFTQNKGDETNFMGSYCIPKIVSRLWR